MATGFVLALVAMGVSAGSYSWPGVLAVAGALVLLGAAFGVLWKFFGSPIFKLIARTNEFLDDWFGVPERAGVPARKGVMVRLSDVEQGKADRKEIADLVAMITEKADASEVAALRQVLDQHIHDIDTVQEHRVG